MGGSSETRAGKALIVHNASAGEKSLSERDLVGAAERAGYAARCQPKKKMDLAAAEDFALIVAAGGDGTVAELLCRLGERRVPVAIVPAGSANNVATFLGIDSIEAGLKAIGARGRRRLDLGAAEWGKEKRIFVESVGLGPTVAMLSADIDSDGAEKIADGRRALRGAVEEAKPLELEIEADGEPLAGPWLMAEILNIGMSGPNLCLAPDADPGDGAFDLALLRPGYRGEMAAWIEAPEGPPPLVHVRARDVSVRGKGSFRVDDECRALGKGETLRLTIARQVELMVDEG